MRTRFQPIALARLFSVFLLLVFLAVIVPVRSFAQQASHRRNPATGQQQNPEDEARAKLEKEMAKKANQQRQAELKRDADRLLKLATDLKHYVDQSNENVLSVEVIKKAEEMEKLAKSVKEKMRGY